VLIQVNPKVRLPRTFKRFCGLMVQLLQKLSIRATNGPDKLMRVGARPRARAALAPLQFSVEPPLRRGRGIAGVRCSPSLCRPAHPHASQPAARAFRAARPPHPQPATQPRPRARARAR
jgi:hypothetical protein